MLKKILSYGFIEGLSKGLNKLVIFILPLFLTNFEFGIIGLILALELVLPLISLLGFERAILRFFYEADNSKKFKATLYLSTTAIHALLFIICFFCQIINVNTILGVNIFPHIYLLLLLIYFQGINLFSFNILRVKSNHKKYFKIKLIFQFLKLIFIIALTLLLKTSLGYLLGATFAAIITSFILSKGKVIINFPSFDWVIFKNVLLFSWPFIFHGLAGKITGNVDRFFLKSYFSLDEVASITFVNSFGSIILFAFIGISVYLEPLIYKEKVAIKRDFLLDKYLALSMSFGLIAYIFIFIISKIFISSFYKNYENVSYLIPIVASGYLVYPYYLKSIYNLIYEKKSLTIAILSSLSGVFVVVLYFLLIPKYGLLGTVFSNIIGIAVLSILFVFVDNRYRFSIDLIEILIISLSILLCAFNLIWLPSILVLILISYKLVNINRIKDEK